MGRIIKIELDNRSYVLEFNRKTLLLASELKLDDEKKNPYEKVVSLVKLAFLKNHPEITDKEVEEILEEIADLDKFLEAIKNIMEESVDTLKQKKGNAHWEVN